MDTLLMTITLAASAAALGLAAIVFRMWRQERRRADARIEALLEMADEGEPSAWQPDASVAGVRGMFIEPEKRSPWGTRIAAAAACVVVAVIVGWWAFSGPDVPDGSVRVAAKEDASAVPLELLSLRHDFERDTLTITGVVQNPRTGGPLANVIASASLFGQDGALLATGRAPLDFTQLRPGDESPFVITVPAAAGVARYRVSFRNASGAVIGHIDRRTTGVVASNQR
jgi:hypothetical protein